MSQRGKQPGDTVKVLITFAFGRRWNVKVATFKSGNFEFRNFKKWQLHVFTFNMVTSFFHLQHGNFRCWPSTDGEREMIKLPKWQLLFATFDRLKLPLSNLPSSRFTFDQKQWLSALYNEQIILRNSRKLNSIREGKAHRGRGFLQSTSRRRKVDVKWDR